MKIKLELAFPRISAAAAEGDLSTGVGVGLVGAICSFSSLDFSVDAVASSSFADVAVEPDLVDASTTFLAELSKLVRFLPVGLLPAGSGRAPAAFAVRKSRRSNARRNSASCSAGVLLTCFLPFAACGDAPGPRRMRENMSMLRGQLRS